jgi:hypothetical protein
MNARQHYSMQDLNQQTARVHWQELETHFARGVVIEVDAALDLVEVATCFANDDKSAAARWMDVGQVQHLEMKRAKDWGSRDPELWAVVVAPWVMVQERAR